MDSVSSGLKTTQPVISKGMSQNRMDYEKRVRAQAKRFAPT